MKILCTTYLAYIISFCFTSSHHLNFEFLDDMDCISHVLCIFFSKTGIQFINQLMWQPEWGGNEGVGPTTLPQHKREWHWYPYSSDLWGSRNQVSIFLFFALLPSLKCVFLILRFNLRFLKLFCLLVLAVLGICLNLE